MWGMLRKGLDPGVNVVAVLIMILSIGVSIVGMWATRYRG
jgi:ABC-type spermidine/putrescine transport system permease subunit II